MNKRNLSIIGVFLIASSAQGQTNELQISGEAFRENETAYTQELKALQTCFTEYVISPLSNGSIVELSTESDERTSIELRKRLENLNILENILTEEDKSLIEKMFKQVSIYKDLGSLNQLRSTPEAIQLIFNYLYKKSEDIWAEGESEKKVELAQRRANFNKRRNEYEEKILNEKEYYEELQTLLSQPITKANDRICTELRNEVIRANEAIRNASVKKAEEIDFKRGRKLYELDDKEKSVIEANEVLENKIFKPLKTMVADHSLIIEKEEANLSDFETFSELFRNIILNDSIKIYNEIDWPTYNLVRDILAEIVTVHTNLKVKFSSKSLKLIEYHILLLDKIMADTEQRLQELKSDHSTKPENLVRVTDEQKKLFLYRGYRFPMKYTFPLKKNSKGVTRKKSPALSTEE